MVTNSDVVQILERIADLLDIKGENAFKSRAYRQAAAQADNLGQPLAEIAATEPGLRGLPGFGSAIADKVTELLDTGRLGYLETLEAEVPTSLLAITNLPGVGPKTAALLWREAGITTLDELQRAARSGALDGLPRLGTRSIEKIQAGLERQLTEGSARRRPREAVTATLESLVAALRGDGRVQREVAGSFRRGALTVGDIDLLVATDDPRGVLTGFAALPAVERVLVQGDTKCSVHVDDWFQVDCRAVAPHCFGAAWQYFTGSMTHNVALRARALKRGMTLNEYGLTALDDGSPVAGATEEEIYAALELRWIRPQEREGRGEIAAAELDFVPAGSIPQEV